MPTLGKFPAWPNTRRIVLAPCPASTCPPHSTVTPRILCSGHAIPVPPLMAPTQQYMQNNHATNTSTHQHQLYLRPYQLKNRPDSHLSHLPLLPPFTHLFNTHPLPAYIEPGDDNRDDTPSWPTLLAIQFNPPHVPASSSRQALYHVINLAFNAPLAYTIPQALSKSPNCFLHSINIKAVCSGVVHPVTKETIMKYTKLTNNPVLKLLWVPAMSKELLRLAQGKEGITVATNTIFFSPMKKSGTYPRTAPSSTRTL
jgi:hypothetical protein